VSIPVVAPLGAAHSTEPLSARIAAPVAQVVVIIFFTPSRRSAVFPMSYRDGLTSSSAYMPVQ